MGLSHSKHHLILMQWLGIAGREYHGPSCIWLLEIPSTSEGLLYHFISWSENIYVFVYSVKIRLWFSCFHLNGSHIPKWQQCVKSSELPQEATAVIVPSSCARLYPLINQRFNTNLKKKSILHCCWVKVSIRRDSWCQILGGLGIWFMSIEKWIETKFVHSVSITKRATFILLFCCRLKYRQLERK